ncbi:hypothetical protein CDAR_621431 [Caerostris darwini]|uniref:Uncharacterized protein n=1 Tax=Caerostris darwini TaxID=1538125 RepID=A0AAV4S5V6_9ARAC|nr:hypothetical protein CDAR_621431 [Caerostris darwini]
MLRTFPSRSVRRVINQFRKRWKRAQDDSALPREKGNIRSIHRSEETRDKSHSGQNSPTSRISSFIGDFLKMAPQYLRDISYNGKQDTLILAKKNEFWNDLFMIYGRILQKHITYLFAASKRRMKL